MDIRIKWGILEIKKINHSKFYDQISECNEIQVSSKLVVFVPCDVERNIAKYKCRV